MMLNGKCSDHYDSQQNFDGGVGNWVAETMAAKTTLHLFDVETATTTKNRESQNDRETTLRKFLN